MRKNSKFSWRLGGLAGERGSVGAEFAVGLPVMAVILLGLISALAYFYAHLATLSAANDCALLAAQSGAGAANAALEQARQAYGVSLVGGPEFSGGETDTGAACFARNEARIWSLPGAIDYQFRFPRQVYRSDWGFAYP